METDSSLPALALALSLAFYLLVALGETGLGALRRESLRRLTVEAEQGSSPSDGGRLPTVYQLGLFTPLKLLAMSASLLSAAALVIAVLGTRWAWIALVSLAVLAFLVVLDTVGKRLVLTSGERATLSLIRRLQKLEFLLGPMSTAYDTVSRWLTAAHGGQTAGADGVTLDLAIPIGAGEESLDAREVRMIRGVVEQDKTVAREIMVPRVDMVAVERGTPLVDLAELMVESGHSRIPVHKGGLDQIAGIAHARDILRVMTGDGEPLEASASDVIRAPLYIPESKTLEELLGEFKEQRVHMAIVVDEYGGVSGLVTIEDLLEEIVGEILDEFDVSEPVVEQVSERELIVDARASVDQLRDMWGVAIVGDGFDTMGGFVYQRLGKIPSSGDTVEYDGLKIEVVSTSGRRPKKLRVTRSRYSVPPS